MAGVGGRSGRNSAVPGGRLHHFSPSFSASRDGSLKELSSRTLPAPIPPGSLRGWGVGRATSASPRGRKTGGATSVARVGCVRHAYVLLDQRHRRPLVFG